MAIKTRLSVIDYAVALRLRQVSNDKKPKFQLFSEHLAREANPDAYEARDTAHATKTLLCDRCVGTKANPLPKGRRCFSIEIFKMVICDQCAEQVRDGGPPLHPEYFSGARNILAPFFSPSEVEKFVAEDKPDDVVRAVRARWEMLRMRAPAGSPVKTASFAAYLPAIFNALHALQEEKLLPEYWALPID